jgi:hypothetical protein
MKAFVGCLILAVVAVIAALIVRDYARKYPQDVPWTELNLSDPIGHFTMRKLVRLRSNATLCRELLAQANSGDIAVSPRRRGLQCGYGDGMRLVASGKGAIIFAPALVTSCPVAAALHIWEAQVVQPSALRHFGTRVRSIDHAGSYSCRRLYGRSEGAYSEHATANAFDVTGFRLGDGRRISVLRDWRTADGDAAFLREVRDGACGLFATVLSPDYNAAHADHLHLDQAQRGAIGGSLCR